MKMISPLLFLLVIVVALVSLFMHTRVTFELPSEFLRVDMRVITPMGEHIINLADGSMEEFAISEFNATGFIRHPDYVVGLLAVVIIGSIGFLSTVSQFKTDFDEKVTGVISRIIRAYKEK